ncbi:MAG: glycoside hydrolase family 3 C-terminal domain-containing protein, partial [Brooklawnia sp.]
MTEEFSVLEKASLLSGKNTWQSRDLPNKGVRSIFFSDGPHGVRKQVGSSDHLGLNASEPATCFPTAATVANSWDPQLGEEIGVALGIEAASLQIDVLLGPGLNIKRSPLGGRNFEYFSEDPYLSGKLAAGYVRGIQSTGVAATPKHYAANSQETRRMASDSVVDERTLREIYLTGFEIAVREAHPRALMSSYNLVNGTYANENEHLLTEILRQEWGFDGLVVTDWGGGNDPVAGAAAGSSIEMPSPGLEPVRLLATAVANGTLSRAALDARAGEVLAMARSTSPSVTEFNVQEHNELARRAAEQSMVLLRNEGALLPLRPGTKVALIGDMAQTPRYQGAGSSVVNPTMLVSARETIGDTELELVGFGLGYRRNSPRNAELEDAAVALAAKAEVAILFLGLDEVAESEGRDRDHLKIPAAQVSLLRAVAKVNPNVVVVLSAGSAVEMPWIDDTTALLHGYLSGQAGAHATWALLTGAASPSGKLAETYPLALSDTPTHGRFPSLEQRSVYAEGPFVGYRYYDAASKPVLFPFGFGLSYATFTYSDLTVLDDRVRFTITNTSKVPGAEIAQLYVGLPQSAVLRPDKELKGFAKVHLAPGESREVEIAFDTYTWRHFDAQLNTWQVEAGDWQVMVGASSADIRLQATHRVTGTV